MITRAASLMRDPNAKAIFGPVIMSYSTIPDTLLPQFSNRTIHIEDQDSLAARLRKTKSVAEYNRVAWTETLRLAQLAACTSLVRSTGWVTAMIIAKSQANFYSFAAAVRGLVESTGDTLDAFIHIPQTIADNYSLIADIVLGQVDVHFVPPGEVETRLLHFIYARRLDAAERSSSPLFHRAKEARDYVGSVDKAAPGALRLYEEMCGVTHPAAGSIVPMMMAAKVADGEVQGVDINFADRGIQEVLARHRGVISKLIEPAFNPPLVLLATVDMLPLEPKLAHFSGRNLTNVRLWQSVQSTIIGNEAPQRNDVARVGRNAACPCKSGLKYKRCHGKV